MTDSTTGATVSAPDDPGYSAWRTAAAAVLAKGRRIDPADLPAGPEELLKATTYDGAEIAPLYTVADERAEQPLPGSFPYVRGGDATRDVTVGWLVDTRFGDDGGSADPAALNDRILDALTNGVSAVTLAVGPGAVAAGDLAAVLRGVHLDLAPVAIDAGAGTAEAASALFAHLDETPPERPGSVRASLGAAPLTDLFATGTEGIDADALAVLATDAAGRPGAIRAITVDGTAFHDRGASDAQELAAAVAAGVEYVRELTARGLTTAAALGQIEFRLSATDDQFASIAKFRAARRLWARVAQVLGSPEAGAAPQHAVTSAAMLSRRDPWVNMLRTTLAAFGAGVGGADRVTVLPFDAALPAGALGTSETFAARIARNTQLLLLEESHLGQVLDPAGGSWYVESLTDDLARIAWEDFQRIEADGGFRASTASGVLGERIDTVAARREADIARRVTAVTGVNEFPNLDEAVPAAGAPRLAEVRRYSARFEALRDRSDAHLAAQGARPRAVLVALGPLSEHNVRTSFASNLLASGGIAAESTGTVTADTLTDALEAAGERSPAVAVVCGTDARFADEAPATVAALRAAGAGKVLLAGPEKAWPADAGERPDGFLTMKIDAVETLTGLLDALGVK
ncbi:methylmalonyl-CoA mutase small subunit [Tomitella fengzijianii]|uniref:Methylmalonyl-CoA mutase small subunit n=1 Tax=Tomitella fengzijianii TaxID=2597660 RepID=A0A516X2W8_9ACTN|nr:methylmalonyl-CoA mutase small subunit [Tomitella fengzijianii]QDQ97408.1 methylmalonyl-CoA mutase small subunit [Tomitella fengzijianii]